MKLCEWCKENAVQSVQRIHYSRLTLYTHYRPMLLASNLLLEGTHIQSNLIVFMQFIFSGLWHEAHSKQMVSLGFRQSLGCIGNVPSQ